MRRIWIYVFLCITACTPKPKLHPVSVAEFAEFVKETGYITDAERYDWSIIQQNVYDFEVRHGISWRCPDGHNKAQANYPITQVSYKDAKAYCKWSNTRLPSYEEFWKISAADERPVVESAPAILPLAQVNLVGNVWDITTTENEDGEIRLAGGSYLCNKNTCNGTTAERRLFVDKETGNTHIGFSIIR